MTISSDIVVVYEEKREKVHGKKDEERKERRFAHDTNVSMECGCHKCLNSGSEEKIEHFPDERVKRRRKRNDSPVTAREDVSNLSISLLDLPFKIREDDDEKNLRYLKRFEVGEVSKMRDDEQGVNEDIVIKQNVDVESNNIFSCDAGSDTVDPVFIPYHFSIPDILKRYGNDLKLNFNFHNENSVIIKDLESMAERSFPVVNCTTELKNMSNYKTEKLIFLYNMKNLEKNIRKKAKDSYLSSLEKRTLYQDANELTTVKQDLFNFQMENSSNFICIESANDLLIALKNIIRYKESVFVPKVKKYTDKNKFLMNMLEFIPGISKNVSRTIVDTYKSLRDIVECEDFSKLKVFDDEGSSFRLVGKKQSDLIRDVLSKEQPLS